MSDEQQDQVTEEEEDQQENDEQQQDEDQQGDQQDQNQQGSDQDQQQNSDEDQSGQQQEQQESSKKDTERLPSFNTVSVSPEFKFASLLSEIASIGNSVDKFITTLPSRGGYTNSYRSDYNSYPREQPSTMTYNRPVYLPQQSKVTIMKDQDCQVSMQPQIIIQPTIKQEEPKKEQYRISNESSKFLAQLYQENKKLKRWQNTSNSMGAVNSYSSGYGNSREKFQRKQYQKGIFNVDDRNRQIDQAMEALRLEEDYE